MKNRQELLDSLSRSKQVEGSLVTLGIILCDIRDLLVDIYNQKEGVVPIDYEPKE